MTFKKVYTQNNQTKNILKNSQLNKQNSHYKENNVNIIGSSMNTSIKENNSVILLKNFSNLTIDDENDNANTFDKNNHKSDSSFIYRDESFPRLISDNADTDSKDLFVK